MMPPSAVQLLNGSDRFVVTSATKTAPTLFVKANRNEPSVSFLPFVSAGAAGTETLMLTRLLMLGMPLTNTVASA